MTDTKKAAEEFDARAAAHEIGGVCVPPYPHDGLQFCDRVTAALQGAYDAGRKARAAEARMGGLREALRECRRSLDFVDAAVWAGIEANLRGPAEPELGVGGGEPLVGYLAFRMACRQGGLSDGRDGSESWDCLEKEDQEEWFDEARAVLADMRRFRGFVARKPTETPAPTGEGGERG